MLNTRLLAEKKFKWIVFENDIKEGKKAKKTCEELTEKMKKFEHLKTNCENVDKFKETEMSKLTEEMSGPEAFLKEYERSMIDPEISKKMMELEHIDQVKILM